MFHIIAHRSRIQLQEGTRVISQLARMEKPCVLATSLGTPGGIYRCFAPIIQQHFTIIPHEEFIQDQKKFAEKLKAVFVWGGALKVDRSLLQSLPSLKVVVNGGVGVDHLDIPMINSFGVKVCNTPHVVDNATADLGMGLMLASARKIVEGHHFTVGHETEDLPESSMGTDVSGATLGIVGMGRIGYKVAKRAYGFDMKILYHNRKRRPEEEERVVGATYCPTLEDLLRRSDFIMVVVNLSPQTRGLIGVKELAMMKPTSTLINISRGHVVNQEALVDALQRKVIRAAALDVTYPEPLPIGHPLAALPNVVILPNMGTHTLETSGIMVQRMVTNALAGLSGTTPPDEVKG